MSFLFPFYELEKNSRIVLYGAGAIGYDFFRQIQTSHYCRLAGWVDKQYTWYRTLQLPVDAPDAVRGLSYDRVVVAVEKKETYQSIKTYLNSMGISDPTIFWKEDYRIKAGPAAVYDPVRVRKESEEAVQVFPCRLLREDRLDVVIRYLYARDILLGMEHSEGSRMYEKLILASNQGSEPVDHMVMAYFTEYSFKSGIRAFRDSFHSLLRSMKEQGFQKEGFIPVDDQGRMINGAHRCAAALALGQKAWVYSYPFDGFQYDYSSAWMREHGFTDGETNRVEEEFQRLKNKCGEKESGAS